MFACGSDGRIRVNQRSNPARCVFSRPTTNWEEPMRIREEPMRIREELTGIGRAEDRGSR
jgi:hypothetical protein